MALIWGYTNCKGIRIGENKKTVIGLPCSICFH
jgi:hypothetical protein